MHAGVAKLADARDSKSRGAIRAGSSPATGTTSEQAPQSEPSFSRGFFSISPVLLFEQRLFYIRHWIFCFSPYIKNERFLDIFQAAVIQDKRKIRKTKKDGVSRQEFDALDKRVQRIEKQREQLRKTAMVILVEAAAAAASAIVVKLIAALIG